MANCYFDLWAPDHRSDITNTAFSAFAKHEQEKEDITQELVRAAREGRMSFNLEVDDDFSEEDLADIINRMEDLL